MAYPWERLPDRASIGSGRPSFRPEDPSSCVAEPDGKTGRGRITIINGLVRDCRVKQHAISNLDAGPLDRINAIVVHQTDSPTASGTLHWWEVSPKHDGAHFLIDKDGTIFQTMQLTRKCQHVGKIWSRCYQIHKCVKDEEAVYDRMPVGVLGQRPIGLISPKEMRKSYPDRYPTNSDSIGIEIVSRYLGDNNNPTQAFEPPTELQQKSLQWLVQGLLESLKLKQTDVYRHGSIASKKLGEARDADWIGTGSGVRGKAQ